MKIELERIHKTEDGRKDAIIDICKDHFSPNDIMDNIDTRMRPVVERRMMTMLLLRNFANKLSLTDIAQVFRKDHATALHAIKTMRNLIETDVRLQTQYIALKNKIIAEIGIEGDGEEETIAEKKKRLEQKRKRLEQKRIQRDITIKGILVNIKEEIEDSPEADIKKIEKQIEECLSLS